MTAQYCLCVEIAKSNDIVDLETVVSKSKELGEITFREAATFTAFLDFKVLRDATVKHVVRPIDVLVVHLLDYVRLSVIVIYRVTINIKIVIYSK